MCLLSGGLGQGEAPMLAGGVRSMTPTHPMFFGRGTTRFVFFFWCRLIVSWGVHMIKILFLVVTAAVAVALEPEQFRATVDWLHDFSVEMAEGLIHFLWSQLSSQLQ